MSGCISVSYYGFTVIDIDFKCLLMQYCKYILKGDLAAAVGLPVKGYIPILKRYF